MRSSKRLQGSAFFGCAALLQACQTARMAAPGFLDQRAGALACVGRQGFVIYQQNRAVAAVEVINDGVVYLDRALTPAQRDAMAVAATALLLYKDIARR